jgi:hypothetical protein
MARVTKNDSDDDAIDGLWREDDIVRASGCSQTRSVPT